MCKCVCGWRLGLLLQLCFGVVYDVLKVSLKFRLGFWHCGILKNLFCFVKVCCSILELFSLELLV